MIKLKMRSVTMLTDDEVKLVSGGAFTTGGPHDSEGCQSFGCDSYGCNSFGCDSYDCNSWYCDSNGCDTWPNCGSDDCQSNDCESNLCTG